MSEIIVDSEKVIKALDKIDKAVSELRVILAPGVFKKEIPRQATRPPQPSGNDDVMVLSIDVSNIPFKIKGGEPARDSDGFAFTFLANREGDVWDSNIELARALEQYGKIQIGEFIYQLSKERKFIQRVIFKK